MAADRKYISIICDDIRHEVGDKISLMGCYSGVLYVNEFPATLAKLGVYTKIITEVDDPIQNLQVKFLFGKKELGEVSIDVSQAPPEKIADCRTYQVAMICGPVKLEQPGELRVEVETQNEGLCTETIRVLRREVAGSSGS